MVLVSRDNMLAGALRSLIEAPGGVRVLATLQELGAVEQAESGGSAKPNNSRMPVANALSAGIHVGSGNVSTNALASIAASACCPISAPTIPSNVPPNSAAMSDRKATVPFDCV